MYDLSMSSTYLSIIKTGIETSWRYDQFWVKHNFKISENFREGVYCMNLWQLFVKNILFLIGKTVFCDSTKADL